MLLSLCLPFPRYVLLMVPRPCTSQVTLKGGSSLPSRCTWPRSWRCCCTWLMRQTSTGLYCQIKLISFLINPSNLVPRALSFSLFLRWFGGAWSQGDGCQECTCVLFPQFLFQLWEITGFWLFSVAVHCRSQKTHQRKNHHSSFHHQVRVEMVIFQEPSLGIFYGIGQVVFTSGVSTVSPWQIQLVLQLSFLATLSF